jgi:hypothetical protein
MYEIVEQSIQFTYLSRLTTASVISNFANLIKKTAKNSKQHPKGKLDNTNGKTAAFITLG